MSCISSGSIFTGRARDIRMQMGDEKDPDESTLDSFPFTSGCIAVERTTDPFAEGDNVAKTTYIHEDESGGLTMSESIPHTSGTILEVRQGD